MLDLKLLIGGPIGLIKNNDIIEIDAEKGSLKVQLSNKELVKEKRNGNQKKLNIILVHYGNIHNQLVQHLKVRLLIQVRIKKRNHTQIYKK